MRPLRLQVKGFTAFREAAEVDFTQLDVFAISGPMGAGKSSLLDAMTYALYGRVERVGDRVKQLISQGQPRMAVTLDFEVDARSYRVTRTTFADRRPTRIAVARLDGDHEVSLGEGADRIGRADEMIRSLIGLTYDGFTRSVLLPQGRFAEFLSGDAAKRRNILTELLGLSLFRRMAERAGGIAKEAGDRATWTAEMLATEFADATPGSLRQARAASKDAVLRERALAEAAERVVKILDRWQGAKRSAEDLRACANEAAAAADLAGAAAEELATLRGQLYDATARTDGCSAAAKVAAESLAAAEAALLEADATLGSADRLADAGIRAHRLADAVAARTKTEAERADALEASPSLAEAAERARDELAERERAAAAAELAMRAAETAREDARHADLVAAVSVGLGVGDPCPVCGVALKEAPEPAGAGALKDADAALADAKAREAVAVKEATTAERAAGAAQTAVAAGAAECSRLAARIEEIQRTVAEERAGLIAILGDPLPGDPVAEVERRLSERRRLDRAERDAARAAADAGQALSASERGRDRVVASIERQRERLGVDHGPLSDRAARAIGPGAALPVFPVGAEAPAASEAAALRDHGERLSSALGELARTLAQEADARDAVQDELLDEAARDVGDQVEPAGTLEALATAVNGACRVATADVATAAQLADRLEEKLERKKQLANEVRTFEERSAVFRSLAQELRADRLVAYLQAEALHLLAAAGSERLASLSDGRYRLVYPDDEFLVVDTWNGDDERSVRTLSGGETFLASLALALALADQVRSLSTTDRARLDSLFLDEGFGTLDQETLRVVIEAIERLAGAGRMVGVITHVQDLADQFPRIQVEKSARGSRLTLVTS